MPVCKSCGVNHPNDSMHIADDGQKVCFICDPPKSRRIWTVNHKHSPPEEIPAITPKEKKKESTRPIEGRTKQSSIEDFFGT